MLPKERARQSVPSLAPPARFTKASKQCEAMGANTRRRNGALGATKLECCGKISYQSRKHVKPCLLIVPKASSTIKAKQFAAL